jgi:hypothetical protein
MISAAKGQFVVNGAYPNAVKNVLIENAGKKIGADRAPCRRKTRPAQPDLAQESARESA